MKKLRKSGTIERKHFWADISRRDDRRNKVYRFRVSIRTKSFLGNLEAIREAALQSGLGCFKVSKSYDRAILLVHNYEKPSLIPYLEEWECAHMESLEKFDLAVAELILQEQKQNKEEEEAEKLKSKVSHICGQLASQATKEAKQIIGYEAILAELHDETDKVRRRLLAEFLNSDELAQGNDLSDECLALIKKNAHKFFREFDAWGFPNPQTITLD